MKVVFGKDEKGALVAQAGEVMTKNVKKLGEVEVQGGVTPTILQQLLSAFEAGWEGQPCCGVGEASATSHQAGLIARTRKIAPGGGCTF